MFESQSNMPSVTNIVFAGLGGQGVIKASDIMADAVFRSGCDIKKSEIHGMSQRGGSVTSDVRFGAHVDSPMIPAGQADFLVVLSPDQVDNNRAMLKPDGVLITPDWIDESKLENRKSLNVSLLGALSAYLPLTAEHWQAAVEAALAPKLHAQNRAAFALGRQSARK